MKIFATLAAVLCAAHGQQVDNNETNLEIDNGVLVAGGQEAPVGEYTWTVNLRKTASGSAYCGGVLIAPQYVLTAAHCVASGKPGFVAIGTHFLSGNSDGERISVVSSKSHPSYKDAFSGNDVAILKLSRESTFAPIPLAQDYAGAGLEVKLLGWGQTSGPNGNPSNVLKENDFTVVDNNECQQRLRKASNFRGWVARPSHLCAGGVVGQASCFGDSGGPLIKSIEGGFALVGDVSVGEPCAKGFPDLYGRVTEFRSFIDENSQGHNWV